MLKNKIKNKIPTPVKRCLRTIQKTAKRTRDRFRKKVPSVLSLEEIGGFMLAYRKNTADERVIAHSFGNDIFLPGIPEYIPKPEDVVIDVGAHIGTLSLLLSKKITEGRIFAVEASKESFNLLKINATVNQIQNITPCHLALGSEDGVCTLYHSRGNWGHSMTKKLSKSWESVEAKTLDTFFTENGISKCDLLKLNCEGAEFPILLSASSSTLSRVRIILALYHGDLWSENSEQELLTHLEHCGFQCEIRRKSGQRGWIVGLRS